MRSIRSRGATTATVVLTAAVAATIAMPAADAATAPLTRAQARTVAQHINLHQSDFPGYKVHPYQSSKGAKTTEQNYQKCVGLATPFAEDHSDSYDDGNGAIFSSVTEFVSSRKVAKSDSRKAASAKARSCFKQELASVASGVGATSYNSTVTGVSESPVAGLDAIYGMKFTVTFTVLGYHGTLHGWSIGFSRGNAEVSLNEIGTADVAASRLGAPQAALVSRLKHRVPSGGLAVRHA